MAVTPNSIVTPQTPKSAHVQASTLNSTYTNPTNVVTLWTAGANGARITRLVAIPAVTVAATQLQEFRSLDGGANKRFANSVLMGAYTMAQNTQAPRTDFGYSESNPLILGPNEVLYVGVGVANAVNFIAEGAEY